MDLQELRDRIDDLDAELLALFMKRMELCRDVADYKKEHNLPIFQGGREQQVIDRIMKNGQSECDKFKSNYQILEKKGKKIFRKLLEK